MNALNRGLPGTTEPSSTGVSRKDLLALSTHLQQPAVLKGNRATTQWLTDLGFRISQRRPHHWVLTHTDALPEWHLYSDAELEGFATGKAHEYARRLLKETCP
ncbi:hypothetical protein [Marinobacter goseongensis]|uniref:hypothetical protein n=1 Tax=Marinobacter goseongensis TaxID=453838 RepID=UPI0020055720|nr:hypothetical protein [Marinobacter goseongensis]MCK7552594.1 hypothetical protein [Marinobacter goseongensis]